MLLARQTFDEVIALDHGLVDDIAAGAPDMAEQAGIVTCVYTYCQNEEMTKPGALLRTVQIGHAFISSFSLSSSLVGRYSSLDEQACRDGVLQRANANSCESTRLNNLGLCQIDRKLQALQINVI